MSQEVFQVAQPNGDGLDDTLRWQLTAQLSYWQIGILLCIPDLEISEGFLRMPNLMMVVSTPLDIGS